MLSREDSDEEAVTEPNSDEELQPSGGSDDSRLTGGQGSEHDDEYILELLREMDGGDNRPQLRTRRRKQKEARDLGDSSSGATDRLRLH